MKGHSPIISPNMSARERALRATVARVKDFPHLHPRALDDSGLSDRDARLLRAIDQVLSRRWLTLQHLLSTRLDRPWDRLHDAVKAALLVGAAQIFFLDRVPDHAAVDQAVGWMRDRAGRRAAGFVNALLHRMVDVRGEAFPDFDLARCDHLPRSDGGAIVLRDATFADDAIARIAQQTSHPEQTVRRWCSQFGVEKTIELCLHDLVVPPVIAAGQPKRILGSTPHARDGFCIVEARSTAELMSEGATDVRIQDPASAAPLELTRDMNPARIMDYCAGRGTKSVQAATLHPEASVFAYEVDEARAASLQSLAERRPTITVIDKSAMLDLAGTIDILILDVPCTNSGVLSRRPAARYRTTDRVIEALVSRQRQIIADALALLADDGCLLYATCSIEPAENEAQRDWIRKWHAFDLVEEHHEWPRGGPGEEPGSYHDGSYACLLRRRSG